MLICIYCHYQTQSALGGPFRSACLLLQFPNKIEIGMEIVGHEPMLIASLRSRRLEVVGERENGRARGRHAPRTTSKRLLRRLANSRQ